MIKGFWQINLTAQTAEELSLCFLYGFQRLYHKMNHQQLQKIWAKVSSDFWTEIQQFCSFFLFICSFVKLGKERHLWLIVTLLTNLLVQHAICRYTQFMLTLCFPLFPLNSNTISCLWLRSVHTWSDECAKFWPHLQTLGVLYDCCTWDLGCSNIAKKYKYFYFIVIQIINHNCFLYFVLSILVP